MPKLCILIAASPNAAFFSQIAAISVAIGKLPWKRWEPSILACFGGPCDDWNAWRSHLDNVDIGWVSPARHRDNAIWAQSDEVFRLAPRDADVYLAMDADVLPVASLEPTLDQVLAERAVSGVIAHYQFPQAAGDTPREGWQRIATGLIDAPLTFPYSCSLLDPSTPEEHRLVPFYVNFGAVFFPRHGFDALIRLYLRLRPLLMGRMHEPIFAGQAALSLAICQQGLPTRALPMRFNFPNDPLAEKRYPDELANAVLFHYLRTEIFDRHRIFTTPDEYLRFLAMPLTGADAAFQAAVRRLLGDQYPFAAKAN